jgi:tetratricopeptide (TPR) repeat protein
VYLLGLSDFRLDRYATTVQVLEPILDREKKNLFALYALAVSYGKLHRPEDSIKTFNLFRDSGGDTPLFHLLLGKLYLDLGEYPDARRALEKVVAADTTIPYSHLILGVAYERLGLAEKAAAEFEHEIEQNPREPLSYQDRGMLYLGANRPDSAIEMFNRALAIAPNMTEAVVGLAKACLIKGQLNLAVSHLLKAAELEPNSVKVHYLLGHTLMREGRKLAAETELARAEKLRHSQPENGRDAEAGATLLPSWPVLNNDFQVEHRQ